MNQTTEVNMRSEVPAGMHPPYRAAIISWEGQNDRYRDSGFHGGILSRFQERWAKIQVVNVQYGRGNRSKKNPTTGPTMFSGER